MALNLLLGLPSSDVSSWPSTICWLWPEKTHGQTVALRWRAAESTLASAQLFSTVLQCSLNKIILLINYWCSLMRLLQEKRSVKQYPRWEQPTMWHERPGRKWSLAEFVSVPWMICPTRPEGTDNGQSLLNLSLCQNVFTFTSAPHKVRQTASQLFSPGTGGWWRIAVNRPDHTILALWPELYYHLWTNCHL